MAISSRSPGVSVLSGLWQQHFDEFVERLGGFRTKGHGGADAGEMLGKGRCEA